MWARFSTINRMQKSSIYDFYPKKEEIFLFFRSSSDFRDSFFSVPFIENGASGYEHIRTSICAKLRCICVHSAVHLDLERVIMFPSQIMNLLYFHNRFMDKRLPSESWIHGHNQH